MLLWVVGVCGIPLGAYLLLFVYPGLALTLLRSFPEHRAAPAVEHRTAVVEAGPLASLLYLNNNLHAPHHAERRLAWYRLPARYRARRAGLLAANGGYLYPGYAAIIRRHLRRPREAVAHPLTARGPITLDPPTVDPPRSIPVAPPGSGPALASRLRRSLPPS